MKNHQSSIINQESQITNDVRRIPFLQFLPYIRFCKPHTMKRLLLLFSSLLITCLAFSQQWIDQNYSYDSIMNLSYGSSVNFVGETETHLMDIYLPNCDDPTHTARRPLIVFIHGGAFVAGDKNEANLQTMCKEFAKRGYVTATIDYRLGFISDDAAHTCNFPNYSCVFATDSVEWYRSCYRSIQDGKGALRFLVNRHDQFRIDTTNIFLAGESAGSFVALGVGLMDVASEKFPQANAQASVPAPNATAASCVYNTGITFPGTITRPDLGDIHGTIEPSTVNYTIKGIGNFYGGMMSNLLANHDVSKPKPAIYSFHQPCDMVVPIDSGKVMAGLTWCLTNGYGCYGISNTPKIYGSRAFSNLNTTNNHGYTIENHFTATDFPYNFLFGDGSCADQVNNPCHAYDNFSNRLNELAAFFAPLVSTNPICDYTLGINQEQLERDIKIYPNPARNEVNIEQNTLETATFTLYTMQGKEVVSGTLSKGTTAISLDASIESGMYFLRIGNTEFQTNRVLSIQN